MTSSSDGGFPLLYPGLYKPGPIEAPYSTNSFARSFSIPGCISPAPLKPEDDFVDHADDYGYPGLYKPGPIEALKEATEWKFKERVSRAV